MSITFSPDGSSFTLPTDIPGISGEHKWLTETWYPFPVPSNINRNEVGFVTGGPNTREVTHWLVRRPLPVLPRAKSQYELDNEAFTSWMNRTDDNMMRRDAWHAALNWERSRK